MTESAKNYLRLKIGGWYYNTLMDYGTSGKFLDAHEHGPNLVIEWEEEGETLTMEVPYWTDYTLEQIYNIWMEGDC